MSAPKPPALEWTERGTPRSVAHGDVYYNDADGAAESAYVFLEQTGAPGRWAGLSSAVVAELGFGVGLNFALTAAAAARETPETALRYVAFEKAPPPAAAIRQALARWPRLAGDPAVALDRLLAAWPPPEGRLRVDLRDRLSLTLFVGDAAERLAEWRPAPEARADVWFFDGFAPARNPEMWSTEILRAAFERAKPGGAFATYSAAGWVRRNLAAAGFEAARAPGYGAKRHMTRGRRP